MEECQHSYLTNIRDKRDGDVVVGFWGDCPACGERDVYRRNEHWDNYLRAQARSGSSSSNESPRSVAARSSVAALAALGFAVGLTEGILMWGLLLIVKRPLGTAGLVGILGYVLPILAIGVVIILGRWAPNSIFGLSAGRTSIRSLIVLYVITVLASGVVDGISSSLISLVIITGVTMAGVIVVGVTLRWVR